MWYCFQQRRLRCPQNSKWTTCQPRIRSSKPHRSFWDRNTRETVKPPVGLRKSEFVFSLASPWMFFPWSFKWNKDVSSINVQSLLKQCSFHETMMFASFKRSFSVLTFSVLFGVKNCCNADTPYFFFCFFFFSVFLMCVRVWGYQAHFLLCASQDAANEKFVNRRYRMHPEVQERAS